MDLRTLDPSRRAAAPAWATLLVGWCLGAAWCAHTETRALAELTAPDSRPRNGSGGCPTPQLPTTRELRAVDGVGAARAVDLARWFWAEAGATGGPWARLEEAPGVGPTLAARVRARLAPEPRSRGPESERRGGPG